jgi:hypothetical protein
MSHKLGAVTLSSNVFQRSTPARAAHATHIVEMNELVLWDLEEAICNIIA